MSDSVPTTGCTVPPGASQSINEPRQHRTDTGTHTDTDTDTLVTQTQHDWVRVLASEQTARSPLSHHDCSESLTWTRKPVIGPTAHTNWDKTDPRPNDLPT